MNIQGIKKRILLVEGDPIQRMLLQEYLKSVTLYEVLEPKWVFDLLSASESPVCRLSLVLLDMKWHRVDGVELVLEIRKRNPRLPILGMTDRQTDLYDDRRLRGLFGRLNPKTLFPVSFAPKYFGNDQGSCY